MNNSSLLLFGAHLFESFPSAGRFSRRILLSFFVPFYFYLKKCKHKVDFRIHYRHSALLKEFNPFLSDIDYSLVVKKEDFPKIKPLLIELASPASRLIILDIPQVYLEEEFVLLPQIEDPNYKVIRFFWYFRKYAWINKDRKETSYEAFKKKKAHSVILKETLRRGDFNQPVRASDLLLEVPSGDGPEVCLYSRFLELTDASRIIVCHLNQYHFIYSILPDEIPTIKLDDEWMKIKKMMWIHEYLIVRSHLRVHHQMKVIKVPQFLNFLRRAETDFKLLFSEEMIRKGPENDFAEEIIP